MMRRSIVTLALLFAATSASAAWYPSLETGALRLEVGQSRTVEVRAIWAGIWVIPWTPWNFASTNPSVARVTGDMPDSRPGLMRITALKPGFANAIIEGMSPYYRVEVTVVCGHEDSISAARPIVTATTGEPIALRAVSNIADRQTFTWYHGRTGDMTFPIGESGPEIVYVTNDPGEHHVWVMATSTCSTSTTEFVVEAKPPRRRTSRH
jgi:hypothetical protein